MIMIIIMNENVLNIINSTILDFKPNLDIFDEYYLVNILYYYYQVAISIVFYKHDSVMIKELREITTNKIVYKSNTIIDTRYIKPTKIITEKKIYLVEYKNGVCQLAIWFITKNNTYYVCSYARNWDDEYDEWNKLSRNKNEYSIISMINSIDEYSHYYGDVANVYEFNKGVYEHVKKIIDDLFDKN